MVKQNEFRQQCRDWSLHSNVNSSYFLQKVPRIEKIQKQERKIFLVIRIDICSNKSYKRLLYFKNQSGNSAKLCFWYDGLYEIQTNRRYHNNEPVIGFCIVLNVLYSFLLFRFVCFCLNNPNAWC